MQFNPWYAVQLKEMHSEFSCFFNAFYEISIKFVMILKAYGLNKKEKEAFSSL